MTVVEELRRTIETEGVRCKVIDLAPPIEVIEAALTEADREHLDFLRYVKANHSDVEAAIIPAPKAS